MRFVFIAVIIVGLLIGTQALSNSSDDLSESNLEVIDVDQSRITVLSDLVPHDPILIDDNADFVTLGCSGNGTAGNPYILQDLEIRSTNTTPCLKVMASVTANYTISGCSFSGTILDDPFPAPHERNGSIDIRGGFAMITECEVYNSTVGVVLQSWGGSLAELVGNTIWNCSYTNVWCEGSFWKIRNNIFTRDGWYSVKCDSDFTTIQNNNFLRGEHLSESSQLFLMGHDFIIQHNIIECSYHGLYTHGNNFYLYNNTFEVYNSIHSQGILNNMTVIDCIFRNATPQSSSSYLMTGRNSTIQGCTFVNNDLGVSDVSSSEYSNISISDCHFIGSAGIHMSDVSSEVRIFDSTFTGYNTNEYAISGSEEFFLDIHNIEISGYHLGIWIDGNNTRIYQTLIQDCSKGIYLQGDGQFISENVVKSCRESGIDTWASNGIIRNNTLQWNEIGVRASSYFGCHDNQIFYNKFISNVLQAEDDGFNNVWDDGVSMGNYWSDYDGSSPYEVWGDAEAIDRWPMYIEPIMPTTPTESNGGPPPGPPIIVIAIGGIIVFALVVYVVFRPRK